MHDLGGVPVPASNHPVGQLVIKGHTLLPVVQGGMGVGVSGHRLAGAVAACGAMGTVASVDLRRLHPDLMERTDRSRSREEIEAANLVALDREVRAARAIAAGRGLIAVNVMRAVTQYPELVRQACESGAGAIVSGAGLPLDLPDLTASHPDVALIPILSDARGIALLLRKWMRRKRLPDAIVIEHPGHAGGHLGAARLEDVGDARFDFERVIPDTFEVFRELGIERESVPLIVAGGINSHARLREVQALGAAGAQVGTAFAVTEEGDAHPVFKKVLAEARPEDIVTFISAAGLPARAVRTPWLEKHMRRAEVLGEHARKRSHCTLWWDCLAQCGLRDGLAKFGQFCIDNQLAAALRGDLKNGIFFRGLDPLPFGAAIRPVRDLLTLLTTGEVAQAAAA